MARGWESKSVESQIEGADRSVDQGVALSPEERQRRQKLAGLEMSRRRVLQEIETTHSEVRRTSLEQALAFLNQEIEGLR
jgi:hypothetical protein